MFKAFLLLSVALFSLNSMACSGGRTMIGGKILLTSNTVSLSASNEKDVNDMFNNGTSVAVYLETGELVSVSIEAIKQDEGGVIFTIFNVKSSDEGQPRLIKVESNYKGSGLKAKGLYSVENIAVDEVHGC